MTVPSVANLIGEAIDGFVNQRSYLSMGFIALLLVLIFKYGLPTMWSIVHYEMQQWSKE